MTAHRVPGYAIVTVSLKAHGTTPGDATAAQMRLLADLADSYGHGELRISHEQNVVLPHVHKSDLWALHARLKTEGLATANVGLVSDIIACPGLDYCSLANARSIPIAHAITERYQDLDDLHDLGQIDLHISGCINSCGHHHSGHIGILGVDKDGREWYQVSLGGADGSTLSGPAQPGKVVGPSFSAAEIPDVVEALLDTYRALRNRDEPFIATVRRLGPEPFKQAAHAARHVSEALTA